MDWTLLVDPEGRPGHANMGLDYALLHRARAGGGFLRLYTWSPGCLSFGRNEPARRRYDLEEIDRLGIDTVRRPTGGRAVWHERELTYAVAAPANTFGSLADTYVQIHTLLAGALRRLGVEAALADATHRPASLGAGACFAAPVGGEVVVGGRKLVGSAQVREGAAFLQHGSLLLENSQDLVARVSRSDPGHIAATSLGDTLAREVRFDEVADAIAQEARRAWPHRWRDGQSSTYLPQRHKFVDSGWTWRR